MKGRIVLVGGDGRPSGVPRHILHLVEALQHQHDVTVISDLDQGGYWPLEVRDVRHIEIEGLRNSRSPVRLWRGFRALLRQLRTADADLIWIHARLPILITRLLLAFRVWRPTCPVAYTHHGLPYGRGYHPVVHAICKHLEILLVATSPPQDLVFLNHRMAGWMARDTRARRLARHHVHVLPNCSDLRPLPPRLDPMRKRLVMTGRTGRQKDYDFAVRLLAHLPQHFELVLCGPGTDRGAFQRHVKRLVSDSVFQRITFCGPVPDARWPLQRADAYVLTSRYEGTPIGALEAFEAGLPIILRDYDGADDLISKHPCSLMVTDRDMAGSARDIVALLDRFAQNADTLRPKIKEVWAAHWSPELFQGNAQALVRSILKRSAVTGVMSDYDHDAPARHPDRHRNAGVHPPAPPQGRTAASPSAESG